MEAILKFNLNNQEDNASHMRCVKSDDMAFVLFDLLYNTKKKGGTYNRISRRQK